MKGVHFERALWAMPASYALHIGEEYWAGFPGWVRQYLHGSMTEPVFFANNAFFMAILLSLSAWASRSRSRLSAFVLVSWASANLFWNLIFHLATTVQLDRYSPGLATAVLLYYPVSMWCAALGLREGRLTPRGTALAYAIGAGLMMLVIWAGLWHFHMP